MAIYLVMSYYMMPGKATEYQKWLKSDKMKELFNQLENETGMRHLNTYMPILGLGDYDCEDWYIVPNWAALDKLRSSKAYDILNIELLLFMDQTRRIKSRILRSTVDTRIYEKPVDKQ